jgi:molybdopterin converting factor small subunit
VRIELFGIARARAGREALEVEARNLGEAIRALAAACPGVVPEVVAGGRLTDAYLASLNGERFVKNAELRLAPGDTLLILGAQAGG